MLEWVKALGAVRTECLLHVRRTCTLKGHGQKVFFCSRPLSEMTHPPVFPFPNLRISIQSLFWPLYCTWHCPQLHLEVPSFSPIPVCPFSVNLTISFGYFCLLPPLPSQVIMMIFPSLIWKNLSLSYFSYGFIISDKLPALFAALNLILILRVIVLVKP